MTTPDQDQFGGELARLPLAERWRTDEVQPLQVTSPPTVQVDYARTPLEEPAPQQ